MLTPCTLLLNSVASSRLGTVTKIHPGLITCSRMNFQVLYKKENESLTLTTAEILSVHIEKDVE